MNSSQKSYSLENTIKDMIFREDLFLYNCLQNSLSRAKGFSFDDLKSCIVKLVAEREKEEAKEAKDNLKRMGENLI